MAAKKTVYEITKLCERMGMKPPSGLRKAELVEFYEGLSRMKREGIPFTEKYTGGDLEFEAVYMELDQDETWIGHLQRKGWATVPVLETPEVQQDEFFKWLESMSPEFSRDDPKTWNNKNIPPNLRGIFKHFIGHCEFVWDIREKCYPIFSQLWGTDDLLTSFDGGCFLPLSRGNKKQWIHNDHPRKYKDFDTITCVQGLINLLDNGPDDGGLLLMEGSQRIFKEYMNRHPIDGFGFTTADMTDPKLIGCRPIKVCAKTSH